MPHLYSGLLPHRSGLRHLLNTFACAALLAVLAAPSARAQHAVTGTVLDAQTNEPLIGVNIVEMGTQNGTATDVNGKFSLVATSATSSLVVSYVGYVRQTVPIEGRSTITIELAPDLQLLEDVVVTAFGIERKERALGYSVGQVSGDDLAEVREVNVANALSGKVAGVVVSKPASGASGSSRVIIRGISTIDASDSNQPLYVVDGVPIDNTTISSAGMWGGVDGGDGISGINPDDIESMSVLKGGAAAALYGSRALNGVIVITTKRGTRGAGLGIEYNSNLTFEDVLVSTDFQEVYGQGTRGAAPTTAEGAKATNTAAWGEKMNGQMVVNWDGVERAYSSVGDNLSRFYDRGLTATNTLALTTSTDNSTLRMSGSWLANDGITPSSGLSRGTFTLSGTARLASKLTADAKLNFIREKVDNRPRLSDSPGNPNYSVFLLAPNVDVETMRCPVDLPDCSKLGATAAGLELHPFENTFAQNPYWAATVFTQKDEERRIIGMTSLAYAFTDWLSLQGRFGGDTYTLRRTNIEPYGTAYTLRGSQVEENYDITEVNTDFLLSLNRDVTPDIGIVANFGGNIQYSETETLTLGGGGGFNVPNLEVVTNQATSTTGYGLVHKQVNSLYGQAEFAYKNYLFLTATGRNDWSSALPEDNNSYFYPSVSAAFVFTDAFNVANWLDYGKLRAAYANVGGDTYAYRLLLTYGLNGASHLGRPRGGIAQSEIPLADLKPYSSDEYEVGIDLRGLSNRLGLDFTYYSRETTNQILGTSISATSGFGSRVINAGAITNKGIEMLLTTTPVLTRNIRWDVNFNYGRNVNEVVSLLGEDDVVRLSESRIQGNFVTAEVGKPFGVIRGNGYLRDDQGRKVFDADGLPVRSPNALELGNASPDWSGGISSSFRYQRFTLSGLVDMRFGGDFFSALNANAYANGLHRETLEGREDGIVGEGVSLASCTGTTEDGAPTGCSANTVNADAQDYYGRIAGQIGEQFVYDGSFVKLRELQLAYRVPVSLFGNSPIQDMTVSLVGRNLWLIHSNVPNLDPESSFRNDSQGIGLELAGVPQTRSFGFNINVRL